MNKPNVTKPEEMESRRIDRYARQAIQNGLITPGELNKLPPDEWEEYLQGLQAIRDRLGIPEPA
jgi:hypothetical protein